MGFSITSNSVLRSTYGNYRNLVSKNDREHASNEMLSQADSYALKRAIKNLKSSIYTDKKDLTESGGNVVNYTKKLKAFLDVYNNTLDSSKKSDNADIKKAYKSMQGLVKKYKNELESLGINYDKDGYMKMSSSLKIKTNENYENLFGKKSSFLSELEKIPNKIKNHINIVV